MLYVKKEILFNFGNINDYFLMTIDFLHVITLKEICIQIFGFVLINLRIMYKYYLYSDLNKF